MELQYDENLLENKFFQHLQKEYFHLLETAPLEKWIICIPRTGTFTDESLLNEEFVMAHVLCHDDELPESHFRNMNGKLIKMCNKSLLFAVQAVHVEIAIMFEEIFYTKSLQKYRIWCIETSLSEEFISYSFNNNNGSSNSTCLQHGRIVQNMEQALEFCYTEIRTKTNLEKIEVAVNNFIKNNTEFANQDLRKVMNKTQLLYDHCLDIVLTNRRVSEMFQADVIFARNLKVAIEYYIMNVGGLYKHLFNEITICCEEESEQFNKALLSLSDLSLEEFEIDSKFSKIIPDMRDELTKIENFQVASEKLSCLKRAFDLVSQKYAADNQQKQHSLVLTIDELLPIFIFVILKSDLAHWIPTLHFLKHFNLNTQAEPNQYFGAENFLITTLEATIMYILDFRLTQSTLLTFPVDEHQQLESFEDKEHYLNYLFHQIQTNNEERVTELLSLQTNSTTSEWSRDLCHPLCDCRECVLKIAQSRVTVNSKNALGLTAMHVTAISGHPKMVTVLLKFGAKVNVRDRRNYIPLHYAAQNGHQNTLLMLLHAKANINSRTAEDNSTALNLACSRGHEGCAKAILYFSDHMNLNLDVNALSAGGTALHLAAKWGFRGIVETLLEYGAKTDIPDKASHQPAHYAHDSNILQLLIDNASSSSSSSTTTQHNNYTKNTIYQLNQHIFTVENFSRIDKLCAAIAIGDNNLACFYLGIEPNPVIDTEESSITELCHPLCTCQQCQPALLTDDPCHYDGNDNEDNTSDPANYQLNINVRNSDGLTPLHIAAFHGNADILRILLDNGADAQLKTKSGKTCLHIAVENGKMSATKLLLKSPGVDLIDVKDSLGETPLHYAVKKNYPKLVELILTFEPNLKLKNLFGKRPVDVAKKNMYLSVVRMLDIADAMQTKVD